MSKSIGCDPISEFCAEMYRCGVTPPAEVHADGQIHRFQTLGDRGTNRAGWYVLHSGSYLEDFAYGAFGDWRTGLSITWCARQQSATRPDLRKVAIDRRATQEMRSQAQEAAAVYARQIWDEAPSAGSSHPYLIHKALPPLGLRQLGTALLVPLTDLDGVVHNVQKIFADGTKRFTKSARVTGLCCAIGRLDSVRELVISEGWATGATLHLPNNVPVLAAMTAGNLMHVAKAARRRWPSSDIVIAGDDDRFTPSNPGRSAATAAAIATGSRVAFPPFLISDKSGTDFNDFYMARLRERS